MKSDSGKSYGSRDLQTFAEDAEDTELTFAIKDLGDYKADQVYIEDGLLKVEAKGLKEGALILTAQDSEGASCDVEVATVPCREHSRPCPGNRRRACGPCACPPSGEVYP